LHPPHYYKIRKVLLGIRYLLLSYSNLLIIIDLCNNFEMKWLKVSNIKNVSWIVPDITLSVLNYNGLNLYSVNDFNMFSDNLTVCMQLKKNLFRSLLLGVKPVFNLLKNYLAPLENVFKNINNLWDYSCAFSFVFSQSEKLVDISYSSEATSNASTIVIANDGKMAVAYEEENYIVIYSKEKSPLLQIDKLKLSIGNDILKMCFSPNSDYLLIWRNDSVQVLEVITGKMLVNLDVRWCPVLTVEIEENSESIKLILCDNNVYHYTILGKNTRLTLPKKLVSKPHPNEYFGPYSYYRDSNNVFKPYTNFDFSGFDWESSPNNWFKKKRVYHGKNFWLYFNDGEFFLNGDENKQFSHKFYDFKKCLQSEMLVESKAIRIYLREKNDLFSGLHEINERYFILISRMLNSAILFDIKKMKVVSAYKVNGNIIGYSVDIQSLNIDIFIDREPYQQSLSIKI
ncbi:MAG: hypothetical protein IJD88_05010, partial [Clostridia bacterium]|nr:hypothetical protein [Clostridia bacterium]